MNKKFVSVFLTGLLAVTMGFAVQQPKVQASGKYTIVKSSFPIGGGTIYHAKSFTKNAYVWKHLNHKQKIANLKNYPNTSWYRTGIIVLKHNGKKSVYYMVDNFSPLSKKTLTGFVWRGYLKKGYNPNFSKVNSISLNLASNTDYNRFIKQSPSQALTRKVLALFPNSKVDVKASEYALYRDPQKKPQGTVLEFKDLDRYVDNPNHNTESQRVAKIKSILLNNGVDLDGHYTIGISLKNFVFNPNIDDQQQGLVLVER